MGDEGIGILAARRLAGIAEIAARAEVIDGGTGGFHLLGFFQEYPRLILIDAAMDARPPGTVSHLHPRFASDFPKSLSAHDIGLRDLIEAASILGPCPRLIWSRFPSPRSNPCSLDVSLPVQAALPEVEALIGRILDGRSG